MTTSIIITIAVLFLWGAAMTWATFKCADTNHYLRGRNAMLHALAFDRAHLTDNATAYATNRYSTMGCWSVEIVDYDDNGDNARSVVIKTFYDRDLEYSRLCARELADAINQSY